MLKKTALLTAAGLLVPFAAANAQANTDAQASTPAPAAAPAATPAPAAAPAPAVEPGPVKPTAQADFTVGKAVVDPKGGSVGTVDKVMPEGAVVNTGSNMVLLPFSSFGKNNLGLVVGVTKAELDAQAAAAAQASGTSATVPATQADFVAGTAVNGPKGNSVGTVEEVTADGAVVNTGTNRVLLPFASFGKNDAGLVIGLSKTELDAQASAAAGQQ